MGQVKFSRIRLVSLLAGMILFIYGSFIVRGNSSINHTTFIAQNDDSLFMSFVAPEIANGEGLFLSACQRCHSTHVSHYKTVSEWDTIVQRMGNNAGLGDSLISDVRAYVHWKLEQTDTTFTTPVIGSSGQW